MKIVVTGADGFVGGWLVRELLGAGHHVIGAVRMGGGPPALLTSSERIRVQWTEFDLLAPESVTALGRMGGDAVIHLAAVASGADARQDPGYAWAVNAAGTARLAQVYGGIAALGAAAPRLVLVSTGEVYGGSESPRALTEEEPTRPRSPYAASKLGAEIAAKEVAERTGLGVVVARAFPHTGPGQGEKYVVPALAHRIRTAKRINAPVIKTGNLEPVRDLADVRDVARAYRLLAESGKPGRVYNVATGTGVSLESVVERLVALAQHRVIVESDPALLRANDIACLIGDAARLTADTGWRPSIPLEQTLKDVLDAQTD